VYLDVNFWRALVPPVRRVLCLDAAKLPWQLAIPSGPRLWLVPSPSFT
jgi:hypothetical protein